MKTWFVLICLLIIGSSCEESTSEVQPEITGKYVGRFIFMNKNSRVYSEVPNFSYDIKANGSLFDVVDGSNLRLLTLDIQRSKPFTFASTRAEAVTGGKGSTDGTTFTLEYVTVSDGSIIQFVGRK